MRDLLNQVEYFWMDQVPQEFSILIVILVGIGILGNAIYNHSKEKS